MPKDTNHSRILLDEKQLYQCKSRDEACEWQGEISIWSHLPYVNEEEEPHITFMLEKIWGHDSRFIELTPEKARQLAQKLEQHADEVEGYEVEDEPAAEATDAEA